MALVLFILGSGWAILLFPYFSIFTAIGFLVWAGWLIRFLEVPFFLKHARKFWVVSAAQNLFFPVTFTFIFREGFIPLDLWWLFVGSLSAVFAFTDPQGSTQDTNQTVQETGTVPRDD